MYVCFLISWNMYRCLPMNGQLLITIHVCKRSLRDINVYKRSLCCINVYNRAVYKRLQQLVIVYTRLQCSNIVAYDAADDDHSSPKFKHYRLHQPHKTLTLQQLTLLLQETFSTLVVIKITPLWKEVHVLLFEFLLVCMCWRTNHRCAL